MKRRQFLKAGLGAVLAAGSLTRTKAQGKPGKKQDNLRRNEQPIQPLLSYCGMTSPRHVGWRHSPSATAGSAQWSSAVPTKKLCSSMRVPSGQAGRTTTTIRRPSPPCPRSRRLVLADQGREAENLVNAHFMGRPAGQAAYQTVGALTLDLGHADGGTTEYRRQLNLDTATVTTSYARRTGSATAREVFASAPDQVIVVRLTADQPGNGLRSCSRAHQSPSIPPSATGRHGYIGFGGDQRGRGSRRPAR